MLTKSFYIYIHYIYSLKAKQKQNKIISQLVRDLFSCAFFFYCSILMIKQIDMFSEIKKMLPFQYINLRML